MNINNKTKVSLGILSVLCLLVVSLFLIKKGIDSQLTEKTKENVVSVETIRAEAYQRGLRDGFTLTIKFLNDNKYLKNDTLIIVPLKF